MNTHTPGPWRGKTVIAMTVVLEECGVSLGFGSRRTEETVANARLIAAAPELLEACKTFAEWLRREDEGFVKAGKSRDTPEGEAAWREWYFENLRICDLAQEQARNAIAKATGAA